MYFVNKYLCQKDDVCMYVNLYLYTENHQLKLITTALHDCRVGIRYISYLLIISLKMLNGCSIFLSFWASYSIAWPRCKRSFASNNWCLVWTGSAFPQSFLSCKQSDAERKDFVDIPEQGHSWFYTSLRLFVSFGEGIASPSWGWTEGGLSSHQGDLVITLAARFCNFWSLSLK